MLVVALVVMYVFRCTTKARSADRQISDRHFSTSYHWSYHSPSLSILADPLRPYSDAPTRYSKQQEDPSGDGLVASLVQAPARALRENLGR